MKHRITILNHESTHDSIISHINKTSIQLTSNFTREDKFTFVGDEVPTIFKNKNIKDLNIRMGNVDSLVFNYFTDDLEVNVRPNSSKDKFFQGTSDLWKLLGINNDWSISKSSVMTRQDTSEPLKDVMKKIIGMDFEAMNLVYTSGKLIISVLNKDGPKLISWMDDVYTETGIFLIDDFEVDDIVLSGLRVIMDGNEKIESEPETDDTKFDHLHKTLFHVKPKFRTFPITTKFNNNGLHPKIQFEFPEPPVDDVSGCDRFFYTSLPKDLFIDPYNPGENVEIVVNYGVKDLELPEYSIDEWGHQVLVRLTEDVGELTLHSRYQLPNKHGNQTIDFNGVAFYGCDLRERNILQLNPFYNEFLDGYSSFFTNDTVIYQDFKNFKVDIPVPQSEFHDINNITLITLVLGILIIILQLLKPRKKEKREKKHQ